MTAPVSLIVTLVTWLPVDTVPPCTHFTLDAAAAGVVTGSAVDWAEWLPAVSKASTVYEYVVEGWAVESVNVVVVALVVPMEVPLR